MQPLGINITSTRIISEEMAFGNDYGIKKAIKKCVIISLLFGSFAGIIFFFGSSFIVKVCFHNKVSRNVVYLIAVALPMISISSCITGYFTAVRRVYKSIIANTLEYATKIIVTIFLLNKYLPLGNVEGICFALILGDVISEIVSFTYNIFVFVFDMNLHLTNNFKNRNAFLYRIFRILLPISLTSYIRSGLSTLKQLIIPSNLEKSGLNSEKALADYGTITGMALPIILFPTTLLYALAGLIIPEFSRYFVKKDYKKIRKYSKKLLLISVCFSVLLTIIFLTFGDNISGLFYKDPSVGIYVKIFALIVPIMYVDIIVDCILKGLDAQVNVLYINILDLLISISFILFFVPAFGVKGFIASIFVSELLNFALSVKKLDNMEKSWK